MFQNKGGRCLEKKLRYCFFIWIFVLEIMCFDTKMETYALLDSSNLEITYNEPIEEEPLTIHTFIDKYKAFLTFVSEILLIPIGLCFLYNLLKIFQKLNTREYKEIVKRIFLTILFLGICFGLTFFIARLNVFILAH